MIFCVGHKRHLLISAICVCRVSVLLTSLSSAFPQSRSFIVFLQSFDLFTSAEWFVVVSLAMPDSGDSNLQIESRNKVCGIINKLKLRRHSERKVPSTGFKETGVAQRKL